MMAKAVVYFSLIGPDTRRIKIWNKRRWPVGTVSVGSAVELACGVGSPGASPDPWTEADGADANVTGKTRGATGAVFWETSGNFFTSGSGTARSGGSCVATGRPWQCANAWAAACLTRGDVSAGLPSLSLPLAVSVRASMVSRVQQQPLPNASAASQRTHSLRSVLNALINAFSASGKRWQSTVPK